mmetsp:Transcript_24917/g.45171  ORF Transcript_24917/g.45171 Transcript_24917/m.45171 type:complete len:266 (+) Transcript_24917:53-850(+)
MVCLLLFQLHLGRCQVAFLLLCLGNCQMACLLHVHILLLFLQLLLHLQLPQLRLHLGRCQMASQILRPGRCQMACLALLLQPEPPVFKQHLKRRQMVSLFLQLLFHLGALWFQLLLGSCQTAYLFLQPGRCQMGSPCLHTMLQLLLSRGLLHLGSCHMVVKQFKLSLQEHLRKRQCHQLNEGHLQLLGLHCRLLRLSLPIAARQHQLLPRKIRIVLQIWGISDAIQAAVGNPRIVQVPRRPNKNILLRHRVDSRVSQISLRACLH